MPAPPAVMVEGAMVNVEVAADTTAGLTVSVWVWVIGVALMVADIVLFSAFVDETVAVVWPLTSVADAGWVIVLPVPVEATTTLAAAMPGIGLPYASLAVIVTVVPEPPAVIVEGAMVKVELAADTVLEAETTTLFVVAEV